jgi:predicted lipid-binding transport protein (Tim44 family)
VKDGAHTHGHNGGGGLALAVVLGGLVLASGLAEIIARILPILITTVAVIAGLAVAGWIIRAVLAYRSQRAAYPEVTAARAHQLTEPGQAGREIVTLRQAVEELHAQLAADRAALPGPARHEHLHFHGLAAEQVAAILAARQQARLDDGGER